MGLLTTRKNLGVGKATEVFASAKTVGQQWRIRDRVEAIPSGKLQSLSSSGRQRLGRIVSALSDSTAERLGGLRTPTLRKLTRSCASGASSGASSTSSAASGCDALELSPEETHRALRDIDGIRDLDADAQTGVLRRFDAVDDKDAYTRFVSNLDGDRISELLELDPQATNRLSKLYANKHRGEGGIKLSDGGRVSYRHIDAEMTANEFLDLLDYVDSESVRDILLAVKDKEGNVVPMTKGDLEAGWKHIDQRHIEGNHQLDEKAGTSFWPTGETVKGTEIPAEMGKQDVRDMIYHTVKEGEPGGGRNQYSVELDGSEFPGVDIDVVFVSIKDGRIETAYPKVGDDVLKWVPGKGEDGGFVSQTRNLLRASLSGPNHFTSMSTNRTVRHKQTSRPIRSQYAG